jgi:hypothetical protein
MKYEQFDVVVVPFNVVVVPYPEGADNYRSAVVISNVNEKSLLLMLISDVTTYSQDLMDISIKDIITAGLKKPSVIQIKFFSIDSRLIFKKIGVLSYLDQSKLIKSIQNILSFPLVIRGSQPEPTYRAEAA